jgi:hypothetical protein
MSEFLVELYVRGNDPAAAQQQTARAARAAADVSRPSSPVRCLWSVFVPEDETCLLLYDAATAEAVRAALDHAGLPWEHVSAAASCTTGTTCSTSPPAARPEESRTTPSRKAFP